MMQEVPQPKKSLHKFRECYTINKIYDSVADEIKNKVDRKVYVEICKEYNKLKVQAIIHNCREMKMPLGCGCVRIKKIKLGYDVLNGKLRINFRETVKQGFTVYYLNEHTNGYIYRFHWTKNPRPNIVFWRFIPSRNNKRSLSNAILSRKLTY